MKKAAERNETLITMFICLPFTSALLIASSSKKNNEKNFSVTTFQLFASRVLFLLAPFPIHVLSSYKMLHLNTHESSCTGQKAKKQYIKRGFNISLLSPVSRFRLLPEGLFVVRLPPLRRVLFVIWHWMWKFMSLAWELKQVKYFCSFNMLLDRAAKRWAGTQQTTHFQSGGKKA